MPHSPYIQQVHPPISDGGLVTFRHDLQRIRWDYENDVRDKYAVETALNIGEPLIEQCEFLEAKLTIKKRENFQLATQSEALETKIEALETEIEVLKDENKAYKQDLAALKAKLDMEKEVLKYENHSYKEEFATLNATLDEKLVAPTEQSAITNIKARPDAEAEDANEPTEAGPGKDEGLVESSQLAAAPPASSPRKRELESDSDTVQKPPKKGRRMMVATLRR